MSSYESYSETQMSIDPEDLYDITDDDDIIEVPQENSAVSWGYLPTTILERIYSFLNRDDQQSMALVCRSWYNVFASPSVWIKIRFLITRREYTHGRPEVHYVRKFGRMIHHAEISFKAFRMCQMLDIPKHLKLFLRALELQVQLKSVAFLHLEYYFRYSLRNSRFRGTYQDVCQGILIFLTSQHKLEKIEFRNAQFMKMDGAEVLRIICITSSRTLKYLSLEGFVNEFEKFRPENNPDLPRYNAVDAAITLNMLLNLKQLEIDYCQIFERVIMSCYEYDHNINPRNRRGNLEQIKIFCEGSKKMLYRGILPAAWQHWTKMCPSLKINLIFKANTTIRNPLDIFVVPHMPITSLDFRWLRNPNRSEAEIGSLMRYIVNCGISSYLEELNIVWLAGTRGLADELIHFLQISEKLKTLTLHVQHPVDGLDSVFSSWLQNRPEALNVVRITVSNINKTEDALYYSNLADDYCPSLQQILGLNLLLITDTNV